MFCDLIGKESNKERGSRKEAIQAPTFKGNIENKNYTKKTLMTQIP